MLGGIQFKICGITRVEDAVVAAGVGADYLGFVLHSTSPRYLAPDVFRSLASELPLVKKIGVVVNTTFDEFARVLAVGFDFVQRHFPYESPLFEAAMWTDAVPPERLCLAPWIPSGKDLDPTFLSLADTLLLDTFYPAKFGGTGQTGDWPKFQNLQAAYPRKTWVLSSGLKPDNIAATGTTFVDMSSSVESAPGVKNHTKLHALMKGLGH